jgi:hypothetical protein
MNFSGVSYLHYLLSDIEKNSKKKKTHQLSRNRAENDELNILTES